MGSMPYARRSITISTRPGRFGRSTRPPTPVPTSLQPLLCSALLCSRRKATMSEITVELPDGSARTLEKGATALDLARSIGSRLAKDAVAARVNGVLTDLTAPLADGDKVAIVTPASEEGRDVIRNLTAHALAQAVTRLCRRAPYAIGPAIRDGFYYDFELPDGGHFSDDDLVKVDAEMRAIIAEDQPFTRAEYSIDEALAIFKDQPFKIEIIEAVARGGSEEDLAETGSDSLISTYTNSPTF